MFTNNFMLAKIWSRTKLSYIVAIAKEGQKDVVSGKRKPFIGFALLFVPHNEISSARLFI